MNITGFLFGSGFALLILLLGWANQITSKNKETKELEREFLKKANLKSYEYKKIINEAGSTEDSFSCLVDFLFSNKKEDVQIFEKIKNIKQELKKLEQKYSGRFWILLQMSITLFISGIVSFFLCPVYKIFAMVPNLIFVVIVFFNLINVYRLEKRYTKNISDIMGEL